MAKLVGSCWKSGRFFRWMPAGRPGAVPAADWVLAGAVLSDADRFLFVAAPGSCARAMSFGRRCAAACASGHPPFWRASSGKWGL